MTKRKAQDAIELVRRTPCPAQRNAFVQPPMGLPLAIHCQPAADVTRFAACMLGRCQHCPGCFECQTHVQLTWQSDHQLRVKLGSYSTSLRERADVYDKIAPSFVRDHEAHDQIFALQDQLQVLQHQFNQLQQTLPANTLGSSTDEAAQQDEPNTYEAQSPGGVRKYENDIEDVHAVSNFDTGLPDEHVNGEGEVSDERYETAQSTCGDDEDEIVLKREQTPVSEFALIDQIPSSGRYRRQQVMVVIDADEQIEARRSLEQVHQRAQRDQRAAQSEQLSREVTLRTPRPSIGHPQQRASGNLFTERDTQPPASGSLWTEQEDRKLLKGARKGLSNRQIQEKYFSNRSAEGIKKRRQKLNKD